MMISDKLSGIERELVLQYLIDGNVPVTLTPVDEKIENDAVIHSLTSEIFPVAIKGEQVKVDKRGIILLENPPQSVVNFADKVVKVEFYFNRVGLFFISPVVETKEGLSLVIPNEIDRILEPVEEQQYDFSALIYFQFKTKKDLNIKCVPYGGIQLFTRPAWKSISLENQKNAKMLLERFVQDARVEKNAGNGLHLISVCKYLIEAGLEARKRSLEAMEGRVHPLSILFVDHERIVLGMESDYCTFFQNEEYGIKLFLSMGEGPISTRDIFITGVVNKIYRSSNNSFSCVDFCYSTIQEEDVRFLYEKATSSLFI